ncbi:integral membrane protein DGCR2/IDD-like isoform X2 [Rhopilema esculentum]|uniref:integral membrane protein DGCR2/IDD-like isoform X2 n=1 Tax=Rhopilema esculentum TaxID=499914 RepID=UPI0031DD3F54
MAFYLNRNFKASGSQLPCRDYAGNIVKSGQSLTVVTADSCSHCTCAGGKTSRCINVRCIKPKCENYRTVPGKCCEYTCPDSLPISDTKQLAVILSLSIAFLIIVILIIVVWRRTRKYKRYSGNVETECVQNEQDTNDSIPNNQRQQATTSTSHAQRTAVNMSSIELPPYAPPKNADPETITPCEPPPPYTPQGVSFV